MVCAIVVFQYNRFDYFHTKSRLQINVTDDKNNLGNNEDNTGFESIQDIPYNALGQKPKRAFSPRQQVSSKATIFCCGVKLL